MAIPAHLWLKDDGGLNIKGSSTVFGREDSIEVIGFSHGLNLPVDGNNGKITGTRIHSPMNFQKEFDASSPYLYKAAATGQTLSSGELHWYRINSAGKEEVYFIMRLENIRITGVNPGMPNTKKPSSEYINHLEFISMLYERITWHYIDGNIQFSDAWNDR